jgi:predicted DsbA family dithiol-disulfide isomerase
VLSTLFPGPFCYIGYKNYNQGVALAKQKNLDLDLDLEFKPFLLDPTLTSEPMVKRDRYAQKFGGKERVAAMEQQMVQRGKDVGINLCVSLCLLSVVSFADLHCRFAYFHCRTQLVRRHALTDTRLSQSHGPCL